MPTLLVLRRTSPWYNFYSSTAKFFCQLLTGLYCCDILRGMDELDNILAEINQLLLEIEEYNSDPAEDIFSRGDILECKRIALISKASKLMGDNNVVQLFD